MEIKYLHSPTYVAVVVGDFSQNKVLGQSIDGGFLDRSMPIDDLDLSV